MNRVRNPPPPGSKTATRDQTVAMLARRLQRRPKIEPTWSNVSCLLGCRGKRMRTTYMPRKEFEGRCQLM